MLPVLSSFNYSVYSWDTITMKRRNFLKSTAAITLLSANTGIALNSGKKHPTALQSDRTDWVNTLVKIGNPLLTALAGDHLKERMPVETRAASSTAARRKSAHLEAFARLICGMAPWLDLHESNSVESKIRERMLDLVRQSLANAANPRARDYMNFDEGSQPLCDSAFLALALIRAPKLWESIDSNTKQNVISALRCTRSIKPALNNWLLFSAMIEAFFLSIGEEYQQERIDYSLTMLDQWYMGDGMYGDGPEFHWDYYNSYVIQPFMRTIIGVMARNDQNYAAVEEKFNKIAARYAVIQERLIDEEGRFPAIGRSIVYRCGAFHHLANEALLRKLPGQITPAQARTALNAVIKSTLGHPSNFDDAGWLTLGLCGHQPELAEGYISTGSLYLCSTAFLPLGLPETDRFWTSPAEASTSTKIWSRENVLLDAALKL
jgi:hypothetical protein